MATRSDGLPPLTSRIKRGLRRRAPRHREGFVTLAAILTPRPKAGAR